ncbi:hypothetical protein Dda_7418 [Drechslerella dactyloides]|uniref:Uncharacterized protein n=1 Tax=Drechslerella dactyloides TaxID=74499 RepID=A0AAD6ISK7_DREDA|nr:hypothetical protein Dda_7418 [Drechslerella dactyloides]
MQPQNQAELPYASRVIHLFNLYTGESALSPISNVQLFPNCQYMGKTPITGYKSQIVAFAPRQMVTVTKIEPRMIRIGRNDRIVTLYCTNPSTGVGAWVTESYLRPLEPDVQEISAWSVGTIAEKRHEKVNDNSMECSDDGSGEESDDSEFDSDNIMIYYSCPPSVPEEPNSSSSAPLQVKQEVLPIMSARYSEIKQAPDERYRNQ